MKAKEAPEKIYLCPSELAGIDYDEEWYDRPFGDSIEYTRTDTFIEKAKKYIANHFLAPGMGNEINDFVTYMKGE